MIPVEMRAGTPAAAVEVQMSIGVHVTTTLFRRVNRHRICHKRCGCHQMTLLNVETVLLRTVIADVVTD